MRIDLPERIFRITDSSGFRNLALEVYRYQIENNTVYKEFVINLGRKRKPPQCVSEIPFLPAEFFRNHKVISEGLTSEAVFESSGTAGMSPSCHWVHSLSIYETSFLSTFRLFYGEPSGFMIAAILPSYTDRSNSSLVYMMETLVNKSMNPLSGFYEDDIGMLLGNINKAKEKGIRIILIGVSFALLDLAEKYSPDLSGTIIMETGGMKGKRNEITREELHAILRKKFKVSVIHSEYGMTELLSQAYSKGEGIFHSPPWMKILIRDPQDPLSIISDPGRTGGINVIDLANIYSCPFIATDDLGRLYEDGGFEVLGRFDNSDIRGCNLLVD